MDLDEMRAFVAVVDNGSFKSAASASRQPRGTLRRRVEALEARAGVRLLERGRLGVSVTRAGSLLARQGRQMIRDAGALFGMLRTLQGQDVTARIGLPMGIPPGVLHKLFVFAQRSFPNSRLELRFAEDPARELLDSVDVAFCFTRQLPGGQLFTRPLVEMREGLRASPAYLERHGTPTTLAQLREHLLLAWLEPGCEGTRLPLLSGGSLEIDSNVASGDFGLLRRFAHEGYGIALLPDASMPDFDADERELVPVLPDLIGRTHHIHLVVPTALAETQKFQALTDAFQRFLALTLPGQTVLPWRPD